MPRTDMEIIDSVVAEWHAGAGVSISVRAVLWMINVLRKAYGDGTTCEGVIDALTNLSREAGRIRSNIQEEYLKDRP